MKISPKVAPFVFISVSGNETTIIIPHDTHTVESWESTKELIQKAYIRECILKQPREHSNGSAQVVEMLEAHPEFRCDFMATERMLSWEMPGGD